MRTGHLTAALIPSSVMAGALMRCSYAMRALTGDAASVTSRYHAAWTVLRERAGDDDA